MDKRRSFLLLLLLVTGMIGVAVRLFYIQTAASAGSAVERGDLTFQSVRQREQSLELTSGRGQFLDRNLHPLTGDSYPSLLLFPIETKDDSMQSAAQAASLLGTTVQQWNAFRSSIQVPQYWTSGIQREPVRLTKEQETAIRGLGLEGVVIVPFEKRYIPPFDAAHLIGYIGQDPARINREFMMEKESGKLNERSRIGSSGLEKTFQPLIAGLGPTSISLFTDAQHAPLPGLGYRLIHPDNPYYPLQVVTTLDAAIQSKLERLADRMKLQDGAIVVLGAEKADVVAMVSRPSYDPNRIALESGAWENRALTEQIPGSIFKTVIAAAALESGAASPDEAFECRGALGKYHFTCWKPEGHGILTFREGFAESCNIVFGEVMTRLDPAKVVETAESLGIGVKNGWYGDVLNLQDFSQLDREEPGTVYAPGADLTDTGANMQTAIGQRDVRMSPLQAANMVVTLLNGGRLQEVRAVKEVRYADGRLLVKFPGKQPAGIPHSVSRQTAKKLTEWMQDVVEEGTGKILQGAKWKLAGKSGTAQVPEKGTVRINQWFTGYGPADHPKYAVAVVSLKQRVSDSKALLLFKETMNILADQEAAEQKNGKITER